MLLLRQNDGKLMNESLTRIVRAVRFVRVVYTSNKSSAARAVRWDGLTFQFDAGRSDVIGFDLYGRTFCSARAKDGVGHTVRGSAFFFVRDLENAQFVFVIIALKTNTIISCDA